MKDLWKRFCRHVNEPVPMQRGDVYALRISICVIYTIILFLTWISIAMIRDPRVCECYDPNETPDQEENADGQSQP